MTSVYLRTYYVFCFVLMALLLLSIIIYYYFIMRGQLVFNKEFNCSDTLTAARFHVLWHKPLSVVKLKRLYIIIIIILYYIIVPCV